MRLADGSNTISDELFEAARREMFARHDDEYETVHNGSGRSEEMPSELDARHQDEREQLVADRDRMGIVEWMVTYPEPVLQRYQESPTVNAPTEAERAPTEAMNLTRDELAVVRAMITVSTGGMVPPLSTPEGQVREKASAALERLEERLGPQRVIADRGSEAWSEAWRGLGQTISPGEVENWRYMGSTITPSGMTHEFRHGETERREVATEHLNTASASLRIERAEEESGLSARQQNGQLHQWAVDIIASVNSLLPRQRETPRDVEVERPRHVQRM